MPASTRSARSYAIGVGKSAERIGEARPLGSVADDEIGEVVELLWGTAAVNTWNARRAAVHVRRYLKPSPEAISELTSLLAPGDARR